ncbi:1,4-alpha-glucan branching enzyme [Clostridium acidisoli DSM 12555]|uniref:1,4-alpha-glucan branching enzyme n=1 Tax=Clostridium acidisoli DSM 12555 TaxID=1121291 RepID=A0A1W1X9P6_9CLOT|nr:1,4-alpha-glucan branching protein domain-containing protein [Clostridium acidisoli]SMC20735.1 1,4-alpha-glucan branching enzyme [Clostridium acidisoli DSM 12555]
MKKGYVSIVLHSHMPFIRHPEIKDPMEEKWLFEAMNECYIPLINVYDGLINDKIKFKITMSITPPLMSMLEDDYINERYTDYLNKSIELTEKEIIRTKNNKELNKLSIFYNERFNKLMDTYKKYNCRLMNAFKKFDKLGCLEIITCSATHALLPLLSINPETIKAQLSTGVQHYIDVMGHNPTGIWLPECAYTYSLDSILKEYGIKYFIAESKAVLYASPRPRYGTAAPIATPNGVCAFGRDMDSSYQVWSDFMGYPGDFNYREFYRDIGYELPMDYISPYINSSGIRLDTGVKYYKITGKTDNKELYNRDIAMEKVKEHAAHFSACRNEQIGGLYSHMDKPPIITCPYDTELFGHWWFEGPDFIDAFIRKSSESSCDYELTTPKEYLCNNPVVQCSSPNPSSWGENSDYSVWINGSNQWIYRDLHRAEEVMVRLANTYKNPNDVQKRALNQAARELMLAESSDWPFIIKNNTTVNYAIKRINTHLDRFNTIYEEITKDTINIKKLSQIESLDNIFPNVNYKIYEK